MWQPILMIDGYLLSILGLSMLVPAAYELYLLHAAHSQFVFASVICIFLGVMLFLANRMPIKKISLRQGYLITVVSWLSMTVLAAVPFVLTGTFDNWSDAWFEAMSGLTAAGGTVLTDIEGASRAVLLWRSMLNGLGGIGIIIFAVALLPYLGIGGMQIFQRENSDSDDKFMPKFSYIAKRIIAVYLFLLVACVVCYQQAGMSWFDAINHGLTTTSTGGLSTKNNSFAFFDSWRVELVAVVFMILGSLPMTFYIALLQNKDFHSSRSIQVVAFFKILGVYILLLSLWLMWHNGMGVLTAVRYAAFNVISIVTTTGYASTDYLQWGAWSAALFWLFSFTGGCTGSTTGSIKIFRWQVFFAFLKKSLVGATEPNRVLPLKLENYTVEGNLVTSVFIFFSAYVVCLATFTLVLSLSGLDFATAFSAAAASMTNTGQGVTAATGPVGNYAFLSPFAKQVCCVAMLVGRLDVLTVLVIFTRNFWKS